MGLTFENNMLSFVRYMYHFLMIKFKMASLHLSNSSIFQQFSLKSKLWDQFIGFCFMENIFLHIDNCVTLILHVKPKYLWYWKLYFWCAFLHNTLVFRSNVFKLLFARVLVNGTMFINWFLTQQVYDQNEFSTFVSSLVVYI